MPQDFENGRVWKTYTGFYEYATIWVNMSKYVWIYDNKQGSEYVSHNTYRGVTLQLNEYLLRERNIQNPVKDLR